MDLNLISNDFTYYETTIDGSTIRGLFIQNDGVTMRALNPLLNVHQQNGEIEDYIVEGLPRYIITMTFKLVVGAYETKPGTFTYGQVNASCDGFNQAPDVTGARLLIPNQDFREVDELTYVTNKYPNTDPIFKIKVSDYIKGNIDKKRIPKGVFGLNNWSNNYFLSNGVYTINGNNFSKRSNNLEAGTVAKAFEYMDGPWHIDNFTYTLRNDTALGPQVTASGRIKFPDYSKILNFQTYPVRLGFTDPLNIYVVYDYNYQMVGFMMIPGIQAVEEGVEYDN